MAARKKSKPESTVTDRTEQGTFYVRSDGTTFKAPKINATEISKIVDNKYIRAGLNDMQMCIFQEDVILKVVDKNKEEDPDLTAQLVTMCESPDVALDFSEKRAWRDVMEWGPALRNPVWDYEGSEYRLQKLNRLPPETFAYRGNTMSLIYNPILPGILLNEQTNEVEYWQRQTTGQNLQLTNVHMTVDPLTGVLGGSPYILPIFPFVKMINYSWQRQMGKVNMWGNGGLWTIEVTDPVGDDMSYSQKVLKNTSGTQKFPLRPNMKLINFGVGSDGSALETITEIGMQLRQFFIPSDLAKDGGSLVGGSNTAEFKKYISFIKGQHRWIEWDIKMLLEPWLVVNKYKDLGYRIVVDIPSPEIDRSELYLKIAREGNQAGSIDENEHRTLLNQAGADLKALDEAQLTAMRDRAAAAKQQQNQYTPQMQKMDAVKKAVEMYPLNPEWAISRKEAKRLVQKTLGLEEGEAQK